MSVKLLTEHHLEFLSLKVDCTGSSESIHVKMPHCWKSHVVAHMSQIFSGGVVQKCKNTVSIIKPNCALQINLISIRKQEAQ